MATATKKTHEDTGSNGTHIPHLRIESYRGIRNLEIRKLAQVNLFAGKNGCGKSSFLEAVMCLSAHKGVEHSHEDLHVEFVARDEPEQDFYTDSPKALGESFDFLGNDYVEGLVAEYVGKDRPHVSQQHDELHHHVEHGIFPPNHGREKGFGESVIQAGQIAEPELIGLKYELVPQRGTGIRHDCLMAVMRNGETFPVGGLGAGARHMMAIISRLARAPSDEGKKPIFLADEIDEGLHRTVHADFWRLLIREAVIRNVQIFATTHSWDSAYGFAIAGLESADWAARYFRLEVGVDREVHDRRKTFVVEYSPSELKTALEKRFDPR